MARAMGVVRLLAGALLVAALALVASLGTSVAPASAGCYPPGSPSCIIGLHVSAPTVVPGGSVTVYSTGSPYLSGTTVTLNVCHLETLTTTADAAGNISVLVTFPKTAPLGPCTITATGLSNDPHLITLSVTVTVTSAPPPVIIPPTKTGEPWSGWIYWVLAAAAGVTGFTLVLFGRRRRTRPST